MRQYVTRTCQKRADGSLSSHGGFTWPSSGWIAAPDWSPEPVCGKGLHGFLNGVGDGALASFESDAVWLLVGVDEEIVPLDGGKKVKFRRGEVLLVGTAQEVTAKLERLSPESKGLPVIGSTRTSGDYGTSTSGDYDTSRLPLPITFAHSGLRWRSRTRTPPPPTDYTSAFIKHHSCRPDKIVVETVRLNRRMKP